MCAPSPKSTVKNRIHSKREASENPEIHFQGKSKGVVRVGLIKTVKKSAPCDASGHEPDVGDEEPGEGAQGDPSSGQDLETFGLVGPPDDFEVSSSHLAWRAAELRAGISQG